MVKEEIIKQIRATAAQNSGKPLGLVNFRKQTGIKDNLWLYKYWTKWGDALIEAGFESGKFGHKAHEKDFVLKAITEYIKNDTENLSFPTRSELKMQKYTDPNFPSLESINKYLGKKEQVALEIMQYCINKRGYEAVIEKCNSTLNSNAQNNQQVIGYQQITGYVYLFKSSGHFKIGISKNPKMRKEQIQKQAPKEIKTIHKIGTDDPRGIEGYWHQRFKDKRINLTEWFRLSPEDVKAFKSRKDFM